MKWRMSGVAVLVAAAWSVVAGAQSGGTMPKADGMDKMQMMDASYTGCLEAGSVADTFTLTHVKAADRMGKGSMKTDSMQKDTMAKEGMSHDSMAPTTVMLSGSQGELRKHLGHTVTIAGPLAREKKDAMAKEMMDKAPTLTVKSLKVVAASCS